ncbi:MAG: hypothetical protein ABIN91_06175 [Mucilaginibacter sp.]|uniref:hypothetical protein n=1 Tax=Mucilaginibacter sp. TaxID=1882438 RepID=UPI0032631F73
MLRYFFILTILSSIICFEAKAQGTLMGRIYEYNTHIHLQSIKVTNLNSRQYTLSDTAGIFYIYAKPGDLLVFKGYAYQPDTVSIVNKNHMEVFLVPEGKTLKEVNVAGTAAETKLGSLKDPTLTGAPVTYQRNADGSYKGGIALRFGYGKDKKAIRSKQLTDEEIADEQIDDAFNEKTVSQTIPLRGQELKDFILMYRPAREVFKARGFNMTIYLNDNYKKYMALPADKRKPNGP